MLYEADIHPLYEEALERAKAEGRYGGVFNCQTCGMSYDDQDQAVECCEQTRRLDAKVRPLPTVMTIPTNDDATSKKRSYAFKPKALKRGDHRKVKSGRHQQITLGKGES